MDILRPRVECVSSANVLMFELCCHLPDVKINYHNEVFIVVVIVSLFHSRPVS